MAQHYLELDIVLLNDGLFYANNAEHFKQMYLTNPPHVVIGGKWVELHEYEANAARWKQHMNDYDAYGKKAGDYYGRYDKMMKAGNERSKTADWYPEYLKQLAKD